LLDEVRQAKLKARFGRGLDLVWVGEEFQFFESLLNNGFHDVFVAIDASVAGMKLFCGCPTSLRFTHALKQRNVDRRPQGTQKTNNILLAHP
jgi:hypothetical protein